MLVKNLNNQGKLNQAMNLEQIINCAVMTKGIGFFCKPVFIEMSTKDLGKNDGKTHPLLRLQNRSDPNLRNSRSNENFMFSLHISVKETWVLCKSASIPSSKSKSTPQRDETTLCCLKHVRLCFCKCSAFTCFFFHEILLARRPPAHRVVCFSFVVSSA